VFQMSKQGAVQVLSGDEPLTADHVAEVTTLAAEVMGRNKSRVVLDLGNVAFLDSAGLELLLTLRDNCLRAGGSLQLASPGPLCRDILVATGVAEQFAIFEDVATAVGSYAR
jgi:anti-sigma B factor antagonist